MARAWFKLTKIHCIETEDSFGEDEFYIVGLYSITAKDSNKPKEIGIPKISGVWDINDGEEEEPDYDIFNGIFFDKDNDVLRFEIKCLDRDISSDLEDIEDDVLKRARDAAKRASDEVADAKEAVKEEIAGTTAGDAILEVAQAINPAAGAIRAAEFAIDTLWDIIYGGLSLDKDDLLGTDDYEYFPDTGTALPINTAVTFPCRWDGCRYQVTYEVRITA